MRYRLLYIEDDEICAYTTVGGLELLECYEIVHAPNGKKGWEEYQIFHPDIVVSDVEMPEMTGIELTQKIRERDKDTLILLATGKQHPKDVVLGFEVGIDNYIKKPFVAEELHAHIQALLARKKTFKNDTIEESDTKIKIGYYLLDTERETLKLRGSEQKLTSREMAILLLLLKNRGELVPRNKILTEFWERDDEYTSRSLDVFISKLRKYLAEDSSLRITNIRGKGLLLEK